MTLVFQEGLYVQWEKAVKYNKVVIGIDLASDDLRTFEEGLGLAANYGSELMLFHCLEDVTVAEMEDRVGTFAEMESSDSQQILMRHQEKVLTYAKSSLESLAHRALGSSTRTHITVEEGKAGPRLCELASHWGADLIVLGPSNRGPLAELLSASTAGYVVHHAPCSVLIVKAKGVSSAQNPV